METDKRKIGDTINGRHIGKRPRDRYIWLACKECGREKWIRIRYDMPLPEKCGACRHKITGRRTVTWNGYSVVHVSKLHHFHCMADKSGYIREHRLVMAEYLGRPLESWEIVHHKNGNKKDNSLSNLTILEDGTHKATEALLREVRQLRNRIVYLEQRLEEK